MNTTSTLQRAGPETEIYSRWEVVRLFRVTHIHKFEESHPFWGHQGRRQGRDSGGPPEPRRFTFETAARLFILNLLPIAYYQFDDLADSVLDKLNGRWWLVSERLIDSDTPAVDLADTAFAQMRDLFTDDELPELRARLTEYGRRVEFAAGRPARVYPFSRPPAHTSPKLVVIDPRVRFGRPTITGTGVPTAIVFGRHQAGDSVAELTTDYGVTTDGVEEALRYEVLGFALRTLPVNE